MKTFILQYMGIGHWFNFVDSHDFPVEFVSFESALAVAANIAELTKGKTHSVKYPAKLSEWQVVDSNGKKFPLG